MYDKVNIIGLFTCQFFRPKIGKSKTGGPDIIRRHNKGCNCKRSGCLKNYCECYEVNLFISCWENFFGRAELFIFWVLNGTAPSRSVI